MSPNVSPTVTITAPADGTNITETLSIAFAGTASDPEDGDLTASLAWNSDLDGALGSGAGFSTSTLSIGTHTITASATDSLGAGGSDQITVTVSPNASPTATITAPADGTSITETLSIAFAGTAGDPEDGDLTASLAWRCNLV